MPGALESSHRHEEQRDRDKSNQDANSVAERAGVAKRARIDEIVGIDAGHRRESWHTRNR